MRAEIAALEKEEAEAAGQAQQQGEEKGDEKEDDDGKIGQIHLLLGRHWDRAFARWIADLGDRRVAVTAHTTGRFAGSSSRHSRARL